MIEHPARQGDRRVGESVQGLRAEVHLGGVADALGEEDALRRVRDGFLLGQAGRQDPAAQLVEIWFGDVDFKRSG